MSEEEKKDMTKIDQIIDELVEDHKHDLGVVIEDYRQIHQSLIDEKQYHCLSSNTVSFVENWSRTTSRIGETKDYLFKRFITNIFKYKIILSRYEKEFRANLRSAWEKSRTIIENPDEYRKFFDVEFEKFHSELRKDSRDRIDLRKEIDKRFLEYESNLESNASKVWAYCHLSSC